MGSRSNLSPREDVNPPLKAQRGKLKAIKRTSIAYRQPGEWPLLARTQVDTPSVPPSSGPLLLRTRPCCHVLGEIPATRPKHFCRPRAPHGVGPPVNPKAFS